MTLSSSPSSSRSSSAPSPTRSVGSSNGSGSGPPTPLNMHQNTIDPAATWLVQKYGGTSVGKFVERIAEDIVPRYLDQHKVAIVCSARSGSTKALGTTNLLLRAADEALQRPGPGGVGGIGGGVPGFGSTFGNGFGPGYGNGFGYGLASGMSTPAGGFSGLASPSLGAVSASVSASGRGTNGTDASSPNTNSTPNIPPLPAFCTTIDLLRHEHLVAARASVRHSGLLRELETEIERDCEGLRSFLYAAQIIDEISPRSRDSIVGVGERMACKIVTTVLRDRGIDAEFVSLENIISELDESDAAPGAGAAANGTTGAEWAGGALDQAFYDRVATLVGERIKRCGPRVPVITGFFGPIPGSLLTQIGRGYTDLLSALLSSGLSASELQIWKEVDGIFTADPRKVPTARLIPLISPDEAAELTYYGSEVVHPFTMEQVVRRGIPIRIKNVERPEGGGTVIWAGLGGGNDGEEDINRDTASSSPVSTSSHLFLPLTSSPTSPSRPRSRPRIPTAVTIKEHILIVNIHSNRKSVSHGFLAGIFSVLDRFGVVVDLISTSEVHVSMAIEGKGWLGGAAGGAGVKTGKKGLERLVRELEKSGKVSVHNDMAILSLVGNQMRNLIGIAGLMFTTLAEGNVNIEMISQGASEINISCVIEGRDAVKALNLIHQSCLMVRPEGMLGRVGPWLF